MIKVLRRILGTLFPILLAGCSTQPTKPVVSAVTHCPRTIFIIRHAEKPEKSLDGLKDPNLSKKGYERAAALANVFVDRFGTPDFLIATKRSKSSDRPAETLTPLAAAIGKPIDATVANADATDLACSLFTDAKYDGKVVLIAWHHGNIPALAKALGSTDIPEEWGDDVFDRVWKITFQNGKAVWQDLPQKVLAGDSDR